MYWTYNSDATRSAGALPPEPLDLSYGRRPPDERPLRGTDLQRAALQGRKVSPADCPPIRVVSQFGYLVKSPAHCVIWRGSSNLRWRKYEDDEVGFGWCRMSGDSWPEGDSGRCASWISGSDFVKIQTGVTVLYPADQLLYQGPLPNSALLGAGERTSGAVMAGLEYGTTRNQELVDGEPHARAVMNIILALPDTPEDRVVIPRGTPLAWIHTVPKQQRIEAL